MGSHILSKMMVVSLILFFSYNTNAQIVIDDFATDQNFLFSIGAGLSASDFVTTAGSDIIAGERDIEVGVISGAVTSSEVTSGSLLFSVAAGSTGDIDVIWDGVDGLPNEADLDATGLGGIDLTGGGVYDGLAIVINSNDAVGTVVFTIYTDFTNSSTGTFSIPVSGSTQKYFIDFSSFVVSTGVGADFTNVGAIQLNITGTAIDTEVDLVQIESSLTATLTDALLIDNDFDALASPSDTIRYTATLTNVDDANNLSIDSVIFTVPGIANTALTVGSVTTTQGLVTMGNTAGDNSVAVDVGNIADGASITITYDVRIDQSLPSGLTQLSSQATVSYGSLSTISDDPDNVTSSFDTTVTAISQTIIGDLIWDDVNGNGIREGAEAGLSNVSLDVYRDANDDDMIDGGDVFLATTQTNGSGIYHFGVANFNNFIVDVTDTVGILSGRSLTAGSDPVAVTVAQGGTNNDLDFGYQLTNASIGNFIWNDLNGDGVQDGGEPGLAGVTVYLDLNSNGVLDGGEPSTVTSGLGAYDLTNLAAGSYAVTIDSSTVPVGFALTGGSNPTTVNLAASEDFNDADFGYQQQDATIGDFIWNDLNGNGIQDGGEPGLAGVTVYLDLNSNGVLDGGEPSTVTSGSGTYDLTNLAAGSYAVTIDSSTIPFGFALTGGSNPVTVNLAAGQDFNVADFGYQQQDATIGDFIWNDLDGDGVQDGGEPGLAGVTVYLDLNGNGVLDGGEPSTVTSGLGAYDLTNLAAGSYAVTIDSSTVPFGFALTGGSNPTTVNLLAGQDFNDADFGYQQQDATIGDFIWNDLNGDGIQDGGEPGLAGVTVYLDLNGNGVLDGGEPSTVTSGSGAYDLTNLATDSYAVTVDSSTLISGFVLTGGSNPTTVNLLAGQDFNDADFGYQQQDATIGDFIWNDLNGDGIQDAGEPGLAGVTVYLDLNSNGTLDGGEPTTVTNGSGAYDFTDLAARSYVVTVDDTTVTTGFALTGGSNPVMVNLAAGEDFNDADFGYQQQDATIGDFIWNDSNGDGIQDAGESGLSGVTVYLDLNGNGVLDAGEPVESTDGFGVYDFSDLAVGSYTVMLDISTVAAGSVLTGGTNPVIVNLLAGEDFNDADFGFQTANGSIGDLIWNDRNANGTQEAGELGISGVTLFVDLNSNGLFDAGEPNDVSDASGFYDITGLAAGTYQILIDASTIPAGYNTSVTPIDVNLAANQDFNDADFSIVSAVELSINNVNQNEGNSGTSAFVFDVTASLAADFTMMVDYEVVAGTATAGSDFVASSGTLTFNPAVVMQNITVDVNGDELFETDQDFRVVLSNPIDAIISNTTPGFGVGTIINDDAQPTISIGDLSVPEGNSGASVQALMINLSNPSELPIQMDYQVTEGTAVSRQDFSIQLSGNIIISAEQTNTALAFEVTGDEIYENDETFTVAISNPMGATIADDQATVTIVNDDGLPSLSIADQSVLEGDDGETSTMQFTVALSAQSQLPVSVDFVTNEITAFADVDYSTLAGTVTFGALETTQTIDIEVLGDEVDESDEEFSVTLSNSSNASITDDTGIGTITDNDGVPSVSINDVNVDEGDEGTTEVELTVSLSNVSATEVEVMYELASDTATIDEDFEAQSGSVTIDVKQMTASIALNIIGDYDIEQDETFNVILTSASNASISDDTAVVTINNDDEGADLSIEMMVTPENPDLLETITYDVTVTNNGPEIALNTEAMINLFDRVEFLNATTSAGNCSEDNGVVSCQLGDINNGDTVSIIITAQVTTVGAISAEARVNSLTSDDADDDNNVSTFGIQVNAILIPSLNTWGIILLLLSMLGVGRKRVVNT